MLAKFFNENYINIVKISSSSKPESLRNCEFSSDKEFELSYANAKDIKQIIKSLDVNKGKGSD